MAFDVDLFVIGAGSGGVRAARIAAGYGARVTIAEDYRVGGTCVIRGCVPKKLYVYASRFTDSFAEAPGFGWRVDEPTFDWDALVAAKNTEVGRLSGLYAANLERAGVTLLRTRATIAGPHTVQLGDGRQIAARVILVATGGAPIFQPVIPGVEYAISSNEIFDLPVFPKRLAVVGAGYIAVEFAAAFARLGASVTQVFRADRILRGFDSDLRDKAGAALKSAGVVLKPGVSPQAIARRDDHLALALSDGTTLDVDQVLYATGRAPLTAGLGLETAGVRLGADGAIPVDSDNRTSCPSIYAVGDVTNRVNLTPVAIREGHAFADRVFGGRSADVDYHAIPTAVFITPEIGVVGLTEDEARARYDCVDIYATTFRPMKATLSGRDEKTFMKIVVDGRSDRVLGVHLLSEAAAEMAQLIAITLRLGATKADFDATMALHPTAAEELVTLRTRTARYERAPAI